MSPTGFDFPLRIPLTALVGRVRRLAQVLKNPVVDRAFAYGAKETRTPDPLHAMQVLYQLSYGPFRYR